MSKFFSKDRLQKAQESFDQGLSLLSPDRQSEVKRQKEEVEDAIEYENKKMIKQFEVEEQMRSATGFHHVDAERLMEEMKKVAVGVTYVFNPRYTGKPTAFTKTPYNTIVKTDIYVSSMQDTVLKLSEAVTLLEGQSSLTNLSFLDLIQLAFKRLFKRGKNNG